ncbi:MAG: glycosyltransferase family 4 protein [Planctomycetes bacterium]|nr:glycosyltransferase family 4 protein [Planctomycetota bacterium]
MTASTVPPPHASDQRPRVAVVYHFFAHYREAVVGRLARSGKARFTFFGDDHDYESSIKAGSFGPPVDHRACPTHRIRGSWMWQPGLIRVAASREFDQLILLGNPYWIATWIGAIVGRLTGKRVMFWSHGFLTPPSGVKGWVRRAFFHLPHAHLFYGRQAKRHAVALGWDPRRIHVIGNSLDLDRQRRARETISPDAIARCRQNLFVQPSLPTVVCSCRLQPAKRLDLLFAALGALRAEGLEANALIIGDGPERARLESLAGELGIGAHFEGACYDEERIALLTMSSDLTVCPGFVGLTAIQSMAYGVPVITNTRSSEDAPEVEAIVPGLTGDLFEDGDVAQLARVMRPWLVARSDRAAIRAACIGMVERHWSPDSQRDAIEHAVQGLPAADGAYP